VPLPKRASPTDGPAFRTLRTRLVQFKRHTTHALRRKRPHTILRTRCPRGTQRQPGGPIHRNNLARRTAALAIFPGIAYL